MEFSVPCVLTSVVLLFVLLSHFLDLHYISTSASSTIVSKTYDGWFLAIEDQWVGGVLHAR